MNITKSSIQRPVVVAVFYILITLMGIYAYTRLNYELVPKFTPEVITVTTIYPGAGPGEVERKVSIPIEDALSSVENIDVIVSSSRENFSLVRLELIAGTNVDITLQDVQRKVSGIASQLPQEAAAPSISRFDFDDLPVMRIGMSSGLPLLKFSELARDQIVPSISRLEGVAEVRLLGSREPEIIVAVSNERLMQYGLTLLQVVQALKISDAEIPVGSLRDQENVRSLRYSGQLRSLEDIRNVPIIHPRTRSSIPVSAVADIYEGISRLSVVNRVNLRPSMGIDIKKRGGANAVEMSRRVREELDRLSGQYEEDGLEFRISQDTSSFTLEAANAVIEDLSLAIVLVSIVMLLFLHSLRNSVIVLLSIPTSILTTFIAMYLLGFSLNLLSLLGLSLAIGILVDDSIVVLENIYRHLEMGKDRRKAAYEGRMEIGFTAVSITLIDVVVFLPIIFSSGLVADLLRQFSSVILISTLMSLLVSFTLAPLMVSRFGKLEVISGDTMMGKFVKGFERGIQSFGNFMTSLLETSFRHRWLTLFIAFILMLGSLSFVFFGLIGIEFIKAGDRGEFILELELPKGTAIEETERIARLVEERMSEISEVSGIFTTVGITSSGRIEVGTENLAELSVKLIDKRLRERSAAQIARSIKLMLESDIPSLLIRPIDINLLGLRDDDAVQVSVTTPDESRLYSLSDTVRNKLESIPGVVEITSTASTSGVETVLVPDRIKMQQLAINPILAGATLRTAVYGNDDVALTIDEKDIPVRIQMNERDKKNPEDLLNLSVYNERGQLIPLEQFVSREDGISPGILERTNRTPSVTIKSQVIGRTGGQVNAEFKEAIDELEKDSDVVFVYGGQTKRTQEGIATMVAALAASILLVYFVLVVLYDSFRYPFVVLFSIPMAMIGALLALALTMEALSIFSILGLVMLVGLVGKNAILVVDFAIRLQQEGRELTAALVEATRLRFRPILMTNLSMIFGLIPIALASGAGSEWKNGLAWVIIGGLSSAMLLTLIVVPVMYTLIGKPVLPVAKDESLTKEKG